MKTPLDEWILRLELVKGAPSKLAHLSARQIH
jgi:hypothetical protein